MINIHRGPAPKTRKGTKPTSYRTKANLNQLALVFFSKCYLCESVFAGPPPQIDHFKPQETFPELISEWTNLFPTCGYCNQHRKKRWDPPFVKEGGTTTHQFPEAGLLDPSSDEDDVERDLIQILEDSAGPLFIAFNASHPSNQKAKNTAEELTMLHSSHNIQIREALDIQIKSIFKDLLKLKDFSTPEKKGSPQHMQLRVKLANKFKPTAPYTMLMRSYFSSLLPQEVKELISDWV